MLPTIVVHFDGCEALVNLWKDLLQEVQSLIRVLTRLNLLHLADLELDALLFLLLEIDLFVAHERKLVV